MPSGGSSVALTVVGASGVEVNVGGPVAFVVVPGTMVNVVVVVVFRTISQGSKGVYKFRSLSANSNPFSSAINASAGALSPSILIATSYTCSSLLCERRRLLKTF